MFLVQATLGLFMQELTGDRLKLSKRQRKLAQESQVIIQKNFIFHSANLSPVKLIVN